MKAEDYMNFASTDFLLYHKFKNLLKLGFGEKQSSKFPKYVIWKESSQKHNKITSCKNAAGVYQEVLKKYYKSIS